MPDVTRLRIAVGRHRRAAAALWFMLFAFLGSALVYLVPAMQRDTPTGLLYVGCPAISGGAAGYLLGHRALSAATSMRAALIGLAVVLLAFAIFAPLYVALYAFSSAGVQRPLALLMSVFALGIVITAPITLPIGAFAGWALHRLGRSHPD